MVSEPHGSDFPELDLSRSENMDAVVSGSGVVGITFSAVAISEPAGAVSDIADNAINAGPDAISDLLDTAMLCSVPTETEISRGVAEVIKRSELAPTRSALVRSGYGGYGSRDLKYVSADRFSSDRTENDIGPRFRSVSVFVNFVLDSGWVNMPVCT